MQLEEEEFQAWETEEDEDEECQRGCSGVQIRGAGWSPPVPAFSTSCRLRTCLLSSHIDASTFGSVSCLRETEEVEKFITK